MVLYGELLEIGGGKERMTKYFQVRFKATAKTKLVPWFQAMADGRRAEVEVGGGKERVTNQYFKVSLTHSPDICVVGWWWWWWQGADDQVPPGVAAETL